MPVVSRRVAASLLSSLAALLGVSAIAGCGGGGHKPQTGQHRYHTAHGLSAHSPTFGLPPKGLTLPRVATGVASVEMFDSVNVLAVPAFAQAVAGYTSGFWPTYSGLVARFPHAYHLSIAVNAAHAARCLDVEPGDASPSQAAGWVRWMLKLHEKPCVYANLSTMPAVRANLAGAGLARSSYLLWDANWTFSPHLDLGYDLTQWTDRSHGNNDESTVARYVFVAPPPPNPICFTHRIPKARCAAVRRQVESYDRASLASLRVFSARGCGELRLRERWFADHLSRPPASRHAYRQRALAATRRVEQRLSCPVFAQRVSYFDRVAAQTRAAN